MDWETSYTPQGAFFSRDAGSGGINGIAPGAFQAMQRGVAGALKGFGQDQMASRMQSQRQSGAPPWGQSGAGGLSMLGSGLGEYFKRNMPTFGAPAQSSTQTGSVQPQGWGQPRPTSGAFSFWNGGGQ